MNCKQGDIAIVVRSKNGRNFGKIVTCLRLATRDELNSDSNTHPGIVWATDRPLTWFSQDLAGRGRDVFFAPDEALKPLRGNEQDDTAQTTEREVVA